MLGCMSRGPKLLNGGRYRDVNAEIEIRSGGGKVICLRLVSTALIMGLAEEVFLSIDHRW